MPSLPASDDCSAKPARPRKTPEGSRLRADYDELPTSELVSLRYNFREFRSESLHGHSSQHDTSAACQYTQHLIVLGALGLRLGLNVHGPLWRP